MLKLRTRGFLVFLGVLLWQVPISCGALPKKEISPEDQHEEGIAAVHPALFLREEEEPPRSRFSPKEEYATPTYDIAFKQLLSIGLGGNDTSIAMSFLNCFVPDFEKDPILWLEEQPVSIPVLPQKGEKQTFMDFHVRTQGGTHVVVEMQVKRHILFDERALFYAASTYARQIETTTFRDPEWYRNLRPTIAVQVLNYDSNRLRGIQDETLEDTGVQRTKEHPMHAGEYTKHYVMTDKHSRQTIDHLQMIQIEQPRVSKLFPPQRDFTEKEWWLSLLKHARKYSKERLEALAGEGLPLPESIQKAFGRLDIAKWNPEMMKEYEREKLNLDEYGAVLAVERAEGIKEGLTKGKLEGMKEAARRMLQVGQFTKDLVAQMTGLSIGDVDQLEEASAGSQGI